MSNEVWKQVEIVKGMKLGIWKLYDFKLWCQNIYIILTFYGYYFETKQDKFSELIDYLFYGIMTYPSYISGIDMVCVCNW